jgi:hypothetical protein
MKKEEKKSASSQMSVSGNENTEDDVLDRDQPGPVSVSPKGKEKPSYTYNADKTDPVDPHLSDNNPPGSISGEKNVEDDALDRDKPGPVSVSPEGKEKPSYTHNADKSDPIDPHLADQSGYSKKKE